MVVVGEAEEATSEEDKEIVEVEVAVVVPSSSKVVVAVVARIELEVVVGLDR